MHAIIKSTRLVKVLRAKSIIDPQKWITTELVDKEWPLCLPSSPPAILLGHYRLYSDNSDVDEVDKIKKYKV